MYALARNAWKYVDRDKRTDKIQLLEYDYLAPDTINELFTSLKLMETLTGIAYAKTATGNKKIIDKSTIGKQLLKTGNKIVNDLEILAENIENSKRKTVLLKVLPAYKVFEELVIYYGVIGILDFIKQGAFASFEDMTAALPLKTKRTEWVNIGGQLIHTEDLSQLKEKIHTGKIKSWNHVHDHYRQLGEKYPMQKQKHALAALSEITGISLRKMDEHQFSNLLNSVIATKEWMTKCIYDSRAKDYVNPFRKMVYENFAEMNEVVGKLEENSFIKDQNESLAIFKTAILQIKKTFKIKN
jgi:hypothetical protein